MRRRMSIKPSPAMMRFSRIFAGFFALVGLLFVVIGLTQLHHSGLFGIVWTLMACGFVGVGIYGACNKKGLYFGYEFEIEDGPAPAAPPDCKEGDVEARLRRVQNLYDQGLISREEFEEKRKEIMKDL